MIPENEQAADRKEEGTSSTVQGHVNFDSNLVPESTMAAAAAIEAVPHSEPSMLGNVRELGSVPEPVKAVIEPTLVHTLGVALNVTLNTGLTFLSGLKTLKNVPINDANDVVHKFNFYNPFVRSDKERNTGEGLLRHVLTDIAKITHTVLGREAVYLGTGSSIAEETAKLAESVRLQLEDLFPCSPDDTIFVVDLPISDGTVFSRHVQFSELFAITSWVVESTDESITTHTVNFNIGLNIGAVYDSSEPHAFVRRAVTFIESQLASVGLEGAIDYNVNYAFDATTLTDSGARDTLEILTSEDAYEVVSRTAVASGRYDWIPGNAVDKLFGFGCDLILRSVVQEEPLDE